MFFKVFHRLARSLCMLTVSLTVVAAAAPGASAEILLSLDEAINIALEKGYDMKSHRLSLIQAEQNNLAARYRFRTNVDMNFSTPSWNENVREVQVPNGLPVYNSLGTLRYQGQIDINQPLPTDGTITLRSRLYQSQESNYFAETDNTLKRKDFVSSLSIRLNQPLFTYNRIKTNLRRAELNYERTSLSLTRNELDVIYTVTNSFFSLYRATRSLEISNETLKQQQLQYDTARLKFEAGLIPEVEALRLEVDLATAQSNSLEAQAALERQRDTFKTLIGLGEDDDVGVKTNIDFTHVEIELNRLSVREVDAGTEVSANLSAYYDFTGRSDPTLPYGSGTNDLFDSSWSDLERRPVNRGVTLTFNVPVWDWG
ncbi:MAG: TolC family protein, partial [Candidatus Latescibacteria bacterium]|nr:TolC family protein [Candidatus Latescibacterota bacterium]